MQRPFPGGGTRVSKDAVEPGGRRVSNVHRLGAQVRIGRHLTPRHRAVGAWPHDLGARRGATFASTSASNPIRWKSLTTSSSDRSSCRARWNPCASAPTIATACSSYSSAVRNPRHERRQNQERNGNAHAAGSAHQEHGAVSLFAHAAVGGTRTFGQSDRSSRGQRGQNDFRRGAKRRQGRRPRVRRSLFHRHRGGDQTDGSRRKRDSDRRAGHAADGSARSIADVPLHASAIARLARARRPRHGSRRLAPHDGRHRGADPGHVARRRASEHRPDSRSVCRSVAPGVLAGLDDQPRYRERTATARMHFPVGWLAADARGAARTKRRSSSCGRRLPARRSRR